MKGVARTQEFLQKRARYVVPDGGIKGAGPRGSIHNQDNVLRPRRLRKSGRYQGEQAKSHTNGSVKMQLLNNPFHGVTFVKPAWRRKFP
jgi:hypothetical protein